MWRDIPSSHYIVYLVAFIALVLMAMFVESRIMFHILAVRSGVKDIAKERDSYKQQAQDYADAHSGCEDQQSDYESEIKRLNGELQQYQVSHDQVLGPYRDEIRRLSDNLKMCQDRCKQLQDRKDK